MKPIIIIVALILNICSSLYAESGSLTDMTLEELMNVEVTTAGRKPEKVADIPASVVVITREQIETLGYQNLEEVLSSITGMYFTDDLFSKVYGVRGYWTADVMRNILVLVNDVVQKEYLASGAEVIAIPVEAIDRIEVVRGPMSVIYGSGAFFGVINIFTNIIDTENKNQITVSLGTDQYRKLFCRTSGSGEQFHYVFNTSFEYYGGEDFDLSDIGPATGSTEGKLEEYKKYFNFSSSYNDISFNASYSEQNTEAIFLAPFAEDSTRVDYKMLHMQFGLNHTFSDKLQFSGYAGYFSNQWRFNYDFIVKDIYARQTNGSTGLRSEGMLFWNPNANTQITFGLSFVLVPEIIHEYTVPAFGLNLIHIGLKDGEPIREEAVYTQCKYKMSEKFEFIAGARLEYIPEYTALLEIGDFETGTSQISENKISYDKIDFIPRFALLFRPSESHVIKFLYGQALNRPSFFQYTENPGFQSLDLQPETIQTYELNYLGNIHPKFSIGGSIFFNTLNNLIFRSLFDNEGEVLSYHSNIGKMETFGAELIINYSPFYSMQMEMKGSWQNTTDKRPGYEHLNPAYSPELLGYFTVAYTLNDHTKIALTGNYVDSMASYYDSTYNNGDGTYGKLFGEETDSYFILGANIRFQQLFDTGLYLDLRGANILNEKYYYPATSNNSEFAPKGTLGRGASFLVSLGWKF